MTLCPSFNYEVTYVLMALVSARYRMDVTLKMASFVHVPDADYVRQINTARQTVSYAYLFATVSSCSFRSLSLSVSLSLSITFSLFP